MANKGFIARAKHADGSEAIFRYFHPKPDDWQAYPEEISIRWEYPGGALPDDEVRAAMDELEEALDPLLDGDESRATLPLVITGLGVREWAYYARSYQDFLSGLNELLADLPRFPIQINHSSDPEWRHWHDYVDRLMEAPEDQG